MGKQMRENQILVVIKKPGKEPVVEPLFENTLEAFQKAVDGWIETVTLAMDLALIVNEEGVIRGLPFNLNVCGLGLHGTVLAVGVKKDEFVSLKSSVVPMVLELLGGKGDKNG